MSVEQMREAFKDARRYKGAQKWKDKVDRMSDKQVTAIYFRMLKGGELQ